MRNIAERPSPEGGATAGRGRRRTAAQCIPTVAAGRRLLKGDSSLPLAPQFESSRRGWRTNLVDTKGVTSEIPPPGKETDGDPRRRWGPVNKEDVSLWLGIGPAGSGRVRGLPLLLRSGESPRGASGYTRGARRRVRSRSSRRNRRRRSGSWPERHNPRRSTKSIRCLAEKSRKSCMRTTGFRRRPWVERRELDVFRVRRARSGRRARRTSPATLR